MVGRARTAQFMEVDGHVAGHQSVRARDRADRQPERADEIPVFACSNPARIAPWGELLSTAAQVRGAAGALMDGAVRDIKAIRQMGFPVFHGGIGPLDTKGRGRVMAIDVPVRCAGVKVASGDLIFGDADGVVVVPQAIERAGAGARVREDQGREEARSMTCAPAKSSATCSRSTESSDRARMARRWHFRCSRSCGISAISCCSARSGRASRSIGSAYLAWGLLTDVARRDRALLGPSQCGLVAVCGARFGHLRVRARALPVGDRRAAAATQLEFRRRPDLRHADIAARAALRDPGREVHVAAERAGRERDLSRRRGLVARGAAHRFPQARRRAEQYRRSGRDPACRSPSS